MKTLRFTSAPGVHGLTCASVSRRALRDDASRPAARISLAVLAALSGLLVAGVCAGALRFVTTAVAYYVNNGSASCSDTGAGTTDQPYCTITAALAAHHDPGTTIVVMPGRYREQVTVPASG